MIIKTGRLYSDPDNKLLPNYYYTNTIVQRDKKLSDVGVPENKPLIYTIIQTYMCRHISKNAHNPPPL